MNKKNTKAKKQTKAALEPEEVTPEVETEKDSHNKQKTGDLLQPIYNFFNFFIGGPNAANMQNDQYGKPGPPPY